MTDAMNRCNPWGLSPREMSAIEIYIELGKIKAVGERLGISPKSVEYFLQRARAKMLVDTTVQATLIYDRVNRNRQVPICHAPKRVTRRKENAWDTAKPVNSVFALGAA